MAEFDRYKDNYTELIDKAISFSGTDQTFFTQVKADHLNRLIRELAVQDRPARVLDVGCGHGLIHPMLGRQPGNMELTGVDVAGDVIEWAQKHLPDVRYQKYDGRHLPFPGHAFDMAFAICVMHHVPPADWQSFLIEMTRVVRPGGRVVIFEHNPLNPATQYIVNTCPIDADAVLLRRGHLSKLMNQAGLRSLAGRYILFTPFEHAMARRLDAMLGGVPFGAQYFLSGEVPQGHSK